MLIVALAAIYFNFVLFRTYWEVVQVYDTKKNPDGMWTAVVQMEVTSAFAFVSVADYSVRLQGLKQKDRKGDLVMVVEVRSTQPAPSIDWHDGKLIILLTADQKYQYFATPISGVDVIVQERALGR